MAGVNLSEENACIMATSSELVGIVTRSCKDEAFLSISSLTRIVLQIGKRFGVSELGTDVISYISHVTQQRLQNILEKASLVAQQKNINYKEEERCEQVSDVRAQLKFFEQLDQMEKQRKEDQEREILLKAAKVERDDFMSVQKQFEGQVPPCLEAPVDRAPDRLRDSALPELTSATCSHVWRMTERPVTPSYSTKVSLNSSWIEVTCHTQWH
ncbi:transcription initiation factor TFIID subunit 4 [Xenoophorus captivus]|uniref:Transcription initiation factor TFIID subunit 4 n=1 Tax=Xenoophorus captivus TaxID=1517983 RepID=A0ABV0SFN6_9TELE